MKHLFPIYDRKRIGKPIEFLSAIYKQNQHDAENQAVLHRFVNYLTFGSKALIGAYIFAVLAAFSGPAIIYLLDGGREMMIPTCIPGTSADSVGGYSVNIVDQTLVCLASGFIFLYFDLLILIMVMHVSLLTDILRQKVRMVSSREQRLSHQQITANFRNIIGMQKELYEWVEQFINWHKLEQSNCYKLCRFSVGFYSS